MKSKNQNSILWMAILFCGFMISCNNGDKKSAVVHEVSMEENAVEEKTTLPDFGNVVEVTSTGMNFIMPDEIPSGWTTFRYSNESPMAHFMLVDKLPFFEGNPPTPTMEIEISGEAGIEMMDEPEAGLQTIAVHFKDQGPHEHFMGHDVHLVKLEKGSDL